MDKWGERFIRVDTKLERSTVKSVETNQCFITGGLVSGLMSIKRSQDFEEKVMNSVGNYEFQRPGPFEP